MTFEEITRKMYVELYHNEKVVPAETEEQKRELVETLGLLYRDLQASFQAELLKQD